MARFSMQSCDISPLSGDEGWPESEIEEISPPEIRLTETALKAFTLMRGPPKVDMGLLYESVGHYVQQESDVSDGTLASMPDRHFQRTILPDQVMPIVPAFASSTVGKTQSDVFQYFGFLKINGNWVDPDSEKAINKASKEHSDVTNPLLPGMDFFSGPYILSKSEQSLLYGEFLDDEDDTEGDPRAFRVSPETFAKWAEGVVKVEPPQHEIVKESIQVRRGARQRSKERAKLTICTPQYCAETGDRLTDAYSVEEDPIPLLSPQCVNMDRLPMMFSRSYPLDALQLNRDNCFDAHVANGIPAPSGPERITSEIVKEALNVDGYPESGILQMGEIRDYINQLRKDCYTITQKRFLAEKFLKDLEKEVDKLKDSTNLLRKRAADIAKRADQASRHRRIREHMGNYIEALTHKRARLEFGAQKIHKKKEALLKERSRLAAERLDLQHTIKALHKTEHDFCNDTTKHEATDYTATENEEEAHK